MSKYIFPKVDLKSQPRTNYDLSHTVRTTFAPGVSIPIMDIETIPTDSFRLKMQSLIESLPMVAPSLGRWKARFMFFENPMSNIYGWMDNNERLNTEQWLDRSCHCFRIFGTLNWGPGTGEVPLSTAEPNVGVKPGSLLNYLGLPAGFKGYGLFDINGNDQYVINNKFNAEGLLTYFDIVRNYLVNNQQDKFPLIVSNLDGQINEDEAAALSQSIKYYPLAVLDIWYKLLRMEPQGLEDVFSLNSYFGASSLRDENEILYLGLSEFLQDLRVSYQVPLGGLVPATYLMDFNRGIMNASVGSLESKVIVDGSELSFSVPQLQFKNKMQNLINLLDLSGGRFADVLSVVWKSKIKGGIDKPIFVGSRSEWIYMTDIVATSTTGSQDDPEASTLGQQGGFVAGRTRNDKRAVCNFEFNEYGRFMCIFQLVPDVDYSSGIDLQLLKTEFSDKYIPQYAQIGYQSVSNIELNALPMGSIQQDAYSPPVSYPVNEAPFSVGRRIAWSEYMCKIDRSIGDFSQGEVYDYWVLLRRYRYKREDSNSGIIDYVSNYSTYVHPGDFNYLFVDKSPTARNFRLQVYFDIKAKRPFPKRSMPRL